ncbi:MAG TPA: hypothetical protein VGA17_11300 [Nitrospiraceae bacterium]
MTSNYVRGMMSLARILMIALIAAFAAATVVHMATSSSMAFQTAMADSDGMGPDGCNGCLPNGGDDTATACDTVCAPPFMATIAVGTYLAAAVPTTLVPNLTDVEVGHLGPPEPYPPRSFVLS